MTPEGRKALARVGDEAGHYLDKIARLFTPGKKLTLLVRDPEFPNGSRNFCLTDDTWPEVRAALVIAETHRDETKESTVVSEQAKPEAPRVFGTETTPWPLDSENADFMTTMGPLRVGLVDGYAVFVISPIWVGHGNQYGAAVAIERELTAIAEAINAAREAAK